MNHLKPFNESLKPFDQSRAIKEFCEEYLAYLLDKSYFNIEVYPSSFKPYNNILYEIELRDNPEGTTFGGDRIFTWGDVKDYFIPFLTFLEKEYSINDIVTSQYIPIYGQVEHSISGLKRLDDTVKMKSIRITVSLKRGSIIKKLKSFFKKESVESVMGNLINRVDTVMNGLQELCDQHLIYLQDDGFNYDVDMDEHNGLSKGDLVINITKNNLEDRFYWNDIKDRFIPFLLMLDKNFNVGSIDFYGRDAEFTISDLSSETFIYESTYGKHITEIVINVYINNKVTEGIWWDKKPLKQDLIDTANTYLAYLIDEGFETDIDLDRDRDSVSDTLSKSVDFHIFKPDNQTEPDEYGGMPNDPYHLFYWSDIKDQFIPFLLMFNKEYSFETLELYSHNNCRTFRKGGMLENLLSDNFEVEEELREIIIRRIRRS